MYVYNKDDEVHWFLHDAGGSVLIKSPSCVIQMYSLLVLYAAVVFLTREAHTRHELS